MEMLRKGDLGSHKSTDCRNVQLPAKGLLVVRAAVVTIRDPVAGQVTQNWQNQHQQVPLVCPGWWSMEMLRKNELGLHKSMDCISGQLPAKALLVSLLSPCGRDYQLSLGN